jgi:AraC-like DNA-binding protein
VHVRDLDAPNAMADAVLRGYARQFFGSIETGQRATTLDRVRELVELLLPTGRCSVEQVARSLGVDRRTVHRRLASEGQTFTSLVDAARRDLAERLVRGQSRPLTEVAEILGFSSHSNFTRWFRSRFDCSPSQWRRTA